MNIAGLKAHTQTQKPHRVSPGIKKILTISYCYQFLCFLLTCIEVLNLFCQVAQYTQSLGQCLTAHGLWNIYFLYDMIGCFHDGGNVRSFLKINSTTELTWKCFVMFMFLKIVKGINRLKVRWRHFTNTARFLFVFLSYLHLAILAKFKEQKP